MNKLMLAAALALSLATGTAAMAATYNSSQYYNQAPTYPNGGN